jgi:hypothetical protein
LQLGRTAAKEVGEQTLEMRVDDIEGLQQPLAAFRLRLEMAARSFLIASMTSSRSVMIRFRAARSVRSALPRRAG